MELKEFHRMVGETVMYCQVIEHDVKRIYAAMLKGDYYDNLDKIEKWTLGQTVQKLKELDFSDKKPYISANDYNFLKQMSEKRNHWCHEGYQNFVYIKNFERSKEYAEECRKLQRDYERFSNIWQALEEVRIKAQKEFKGII